MCGSFHLRPATPADETSLDLRELVLDVPQGSAVLLRTKVDKTILLILATNEGKRRRLLILELSEFCARTYKISLVGNGSQDLKCRETGKLSFLQTK